MTGAWGIDHGRLGKKLRKLRSNSDLARQYNAFISSVAELDDSGDPAKLGHEKTGRHRRCYARHLTRSYRLLYWVDYEGRIVHLLDLDDHKGVYGRD